MDALKQYLAAERGRSAKLAERIGISQPAVSMWDRVPAGRVLDVERATGLSRHELRPDLYPEPEQVPA